MTTIRSIRDQLVTTGPQFLRHAADVNDTITSAIRKAAEYIETIGPLVQFQAKDTANPENAITPRAQQYLEELTQIKGQLEGVRDQLHQQASTQSEEHENQLKAGVQAGILDWVNKFDPNWKSQLVSIVTTLISKVLAKSGMTPTTAAPPALALKAGTRVGK